MSEPSASVVPINSLTIANGAPPPGQQAPPSRFILFTEEWLDLQNYVTLALQMPITKNDFTATYGDFPSGGSALISPAGGAVKDVQNLAGTFGDPATLKKRIQSDPNYLNTETPPSEIYAHNVWLGNQIYNNASTFNFTFGSLADIIGPSAGTPEERAANLKLILVGPGGLVSVAEDMRVKTNALMQKLLSFDADITAANKSVQEYVGKGSQLIATAAQIIGQTQADIDNNLQPAADAPYKKWRDYTISAVTASVGVMVLSGGMLFPIALGLGIGLGVAAAKERAAYNALMDQIAQAREDVRKKTQLRSELQGFNGKMNLVGPALATFKNSLEAIESVWVGISANLSFIANNFGVDQLHRLTFA